MNALANPSHIAAADPLLQLLDLSRKARSAGSAAELAFMAVNDSHALCPYRQAALWFSDGGIRALSGVIEPQANAPYAQWLERLCRHLHGTHLHDALPHDAHQAIPIDATSLPEELAAEWAEWLPPHALWLPFGTSASSHVASGSGGLLLAADQPWRFDAVESLTEWAGIWHHAWMARANHAAWSWSRVRQAFDPRRASWRRKVLLAAILIGVMAMPVHLSVLAQGELVPANPATIRAPLDGVLGQFHVQPNQKVKAGQALFSFDQASLAARQEVAIQSLATAQAEYRQSAQQALSDVRSKSQLSAMLGQIEEKRAEADYVRDQFQRATVTAPQDGIALFDDPGEWTGKPVQTGERIMRIAAPHDVEIEAWVPIGDAIPLSEGARVELYLAASPMTPLSAQVRYMAHDAMLRPDGHYAYRVRARLTASSDQRVGLQGTAKLSGETVPLIYWLLRRPLATVRQATGW
jgi:multidrug resistance efflux pump